MLVLVGALYPVYKRAMINARDTQCVTNLHAIRQANEMYYVDYLEYAPSLATFNFDWEYVHCPVGKEAYVYDPPSGSVKCPHPNHGWH